MLPGPLTPLLAEGQVRLGTWMPFAHAASEMQYFFHVAVSEASVRRETERSGAAYVAVQEAEAQRLQRELPEAPAGEDKQLLSVDGAFVGVVGGAWVEVKTLTVGEIQTPVQEQGEAVVHTTHLSYFSRQSEASAFTSAAWVETHRRGVANSRVVCAVTDGAEWIQGFVDWHRPDAVRILDFYHAAEHVAAAGRAVYGEDSPAFHAWFDAQQQELHTGNPEQVLTELRALLRLPLADAARQIVESCLNYLQARRSMITYAAFQQAGYPLGSGAGEACHKFVIETRLKGTGMRWAPEHINPLAALRNLVCNDRWDEGWPQIAAHLRQHAPRAATPKPTPPAATAVEESPRPLLPSGFKLQPSTPWRDRSLGKGLARPSALWPSANN